MKWLTAIIAWFRRKDKPAIAPQPAPAPVSVTILDDDATELPDNLVWRGSSYGNAKRDPACVLRSASLDTSNAYYDMSIPAHWPAKVVKVNVQAIVCFGYEQDGKIIIGKYDWIRKGGQSKKSLENIHDGYNGLSMPAKGTKCYAMIVDINEAKRSNFIEMNWK